MSPVPRLSIVVCIFNMEREARRALYSMSARYQRDVSDDDYEVIVVDNGSDVPFNGGSVEEFGPNFRYHYVADARTSRETRTPGRAMNIGIRMARASYLSLMIDGARMLSPGVVKYGLMLPKLFAKPVGLTHGWHLGPSAQSQSIMHGYSQAIEDELIASIDWPSNGYRLFEICGVQDEHESWFRPVSESNCIFAPRDVLDDIGGFDERFVERGGGLVNFDLQMRLVDRMDLDLAMLLGEGTFHQFHGGTTSSTPSPDVPPMVSDFLDEYHAIRGEPFAPICARRPVYVGALPIEAMRFLQPFIDAANPELLETDKKFRWAKHEWENTLEILKHRDEAIAWLRGEVALRDRQIAQLQEPRPSPSWIARLRTSARAAFRRGGASPGSNDPTASGAERVDRRS